MVIHDLYIKSISVPPHEAHTVLIVNPYTMLARTVSTQCFQLIARWYSQVFKRHRGV